MKNIILFSLLLLINNNSISQVYKFSKKETAIYYLFDDSSKTEIPYSIDESLYNDFITKNDTTLGKYYINQVKFYEVSDSVKNKPDSVKGKNYYYLNPVVKELESYLKLNIRSNKFIDENEPGDLFDYTKEERLKNISENFSDVYDISEYVLVNYEKEFCNDCVLDVTKELIDYNIDEINKKEDIYHISNIEVIVLFKDKKSLLSIFGVKKTEVYLITNIETTEKQYTEKGYMEYYNYFQFTNYDVIGFQPGRILVYGLMWPIRKLKR